MDQDQPVDELAASERAKYDKCWKSDVYRRGSPGEHHVEDFLAIWPGFKHKNVVDWGAGTGRAGLKIKAAGHLVTAYDHSAKCLDPEPAAGIGLVVGSLWDVPADFECDVGFCTDVMEHIPPEKVVDVLRSIKRACREGCYFGIHLAPDRLGAVLVGEPLHLTVEPAGWWDETLGGVFGSVQRRAGFSSNSGVWWCQ